MTKLFLFLVTLALAAAKHVEYKEIGWGGQWFYLTKFCFDAKGGVVNIKMDNINATHQDQQILMYHDIPETGFPQIAMTGHSCEYKTRKANFVVDFTNRDLLSPEGYSVKVNSEYRARWWYFAVASCNQDPTTGKSHVDLPYLKISMTNGGNTYPEFSHDEVGIYEMSVVALVTVLFLAVGSAFYFRKLIKDEGQKLHQAIFMLLVVLGLAFISLCAKVAYWDQIRTGSRPNESIIDFSLVLDVIPDAMMVGIFILVSKGWQISDATYHRLQEKGQHRTTYEFVAIYLVVSIAMVAWAFHRAEEFSYDARFIYQSFPGAVICFLHALATVYFVLNLMKTYRIQRSGADLGTYIVFGVLGVAYMAMLPLSVLIAELMNDWDRNKIVTNFVLVTDLVIYIGFFVLFGVRAGVLRKDVNDGMAMIGQMDSSDGMVGSPGVEHASIADQDTFMGDDSDDDVDA
mmetsp:Transcript_47462/g.93362  ORF Transcript_47462/g.93362 Transcript_47462/m.93362 type:complete len:459 (+) Transcript_47462:24-1400(+)|eukprot:CAMPEP_0175090976 /NCGR_PEP_ID=MMETSP0086_2-20121207/1651_1 /TAXON_ID=136419 /ORGANISM="Unknown Unknown, Strain D1" /LENGTH=458 /DNA_ID=CAMNT_0016363677 /DNA_START=16 /DNA_END=1392 /DNA_ORIENTATION=-